MCLYKYMALTRPIAKGQLPLGQSDRAKTSRHILVCLVCREYLIYLHGAEACTSGPWSAFEI